MTPDLNMSAEERKAALLAANRIVADPGSGPDALLAARLALRLYHRFRSHVADLFATSLDYGNALLDGRDARELSRKVLTAAAKAARLEREQP